MRDRGTYDIRLIGLHGAHSRRLARGVYPAFPLASIWSPSGRWIALADDRTAGALLIDIPDQRARFVSLILGFGGASFSPANAQAATSRPTAR